jgi:hypothetical protein
VTSDARLLKHRVPQTKGGSAIPRYTLEVVIVVLLLLWLLGWLVVPVGGSPVHLLLVIILVVVLIRVLQGRPPVA